MQFMIKQRMKIAAALCLFSAFSNCATAAVIVNVNQVGDDVVITATGNLDLNGLTVQGHEQQPGRVDPGGGFIQVGPTWDFVTGYSGFSSPNTSFGPGGELYATTASGSDFEINAGDFATPVIFVADDYVSGSLIDGSETFSGVTIDSLGFTVGQYVFTSAYDTVTVNVPGGISAAPAVPEPATWAMMILGMGAIGFSLRRRMRASEVRSAVKINHMATGEVV